MYTLSKSIHDLICINSIQELGKEVFLTAFDLLCSLAKIGPIYLGFFLRHYFNGRYRSPNCITLHSLYMLVVIA